MEILSTKKPDVPKKPEVKIEYNNRSYESFVNNGFEDAIPHSVSAIRDRMQQFLNLVDLRKGDIERTVTLMVRLKAPDWNSSTKKNERKEFIYYFEDWTANDWLGIPIQNPFSEHIEGQYLEALTKPVLDERTGEHIEDKLSGSRTTYYIPFSKKNADEIIANSAHSTKDSIKFIIKFGIEDSPEGFSMSTRNQFSYEQFANWSWEKLRDWQYYPVDELFNRPKAFKSSSATKLEFKPQ
jgi:hypothetical protein